MSIIHSRSRNDDGSLELIRFSLRSLFIYLSGFCVYLALCGAAHLPLKATVFIALFVASRVATIVFFDIRPVVLLTIAPALLLPIGYDFGLWQDSITNVKSWLTWVDIMCCALLYVAIPIVVLGIDMFWAGIIRGNRKYLSCRVILELVLVSPLWMFIYQCIVVSVRSR